MANPLNLLVPEVGIEPTRGYPRGILSPVRLPVSPLRHRSDFICNIAVIVNKIEFSLAVDSKNVPSRYGPFPQNF